MAATNAVATSPAAATSPTAATNLGATNAAGTSTVVTSTAATNLAAAEPRPLHVRTPLIESLTLSQIYGNTVYLKMDNVQPSGSFKIRGMGKLCHEVSPFNFHEDCRVS